MDNRVKLGIAFSLLPQILLVKWLGQHPEWVERYYAEGLYPYIAQLLRGLYGWLPFSMGDLFYTALGFGALRYLYLYWRYFFKKPLTVLRDAGVVLAIAYFIFHLSWGLNYYRLPINEKMGFEIEYTKAELVDFTMKLVRKTNGLQYQLTKDTAAAVKIPYTVKEIYEKTPTSFSSAAKVFPFLTYETTSLKSSLFSLPLTYMGYGGYLNPFTNEAQVNALVPKQRLPSISGHEVGHQLGYSSEDSTNFIGLLVTSANPDPYFQYAAQSHGLAYCLTDLRKWDEAAYREILGMLHPGVRENYRELNRFWASYENPTEPIFKAMFNAFLKANSQERGIQSYNAVVGLLIGFDRAYSASNQ